MARVGIIGFGFVGSGLYRWLAGQPDRYQVAFVHARDPDRLGDVPAELRLTDLSVAPPADLVVEAAHPAITVQFGAGLLSRSDYMPLSVSALADDELRARLLAVASAYGHRLLIPHGAMVGVDSLFEWRRQWRDVTITFRKPPASIEPVAGAVAAGGEQILFDGPVREIARRFPRNVNAMVTCALATVGLDRCRGRMISDPTATQLMLQLEAIGTDGSRLFIERQQPAAGVSGSEMFASLCRSVELTLRPKQAMEFV